MQLTNSLSHLIDKGEDKFDCESAIKALQKAIEPETRKIFEDTSLIESIEKNKSKFERQKSFLNTRININFSLEEIGKIIRCLEKGLECDKLKKILLDYSNLIAKVHEAYRSEGRQDIRLREVARILGLNNGKKQEKFNKNDILYEYIELITGKINLETYKVDPPMEKWDAIEFLSKKHGNLSKEACFKLLQRAIWDKKKKCETEGVPHSWEGLLPWNSDV